MPQQQVAQQLRQLIAQYGSQLAEEPRRISALLRDLCAPYKREVRVLTFAVEEGLAKELVRDYGKISATILLPRMAAQLHDELGVDETLSLWAVTAWAEALGWTVPELNGEAVIQPATHQTQAPLPNKPPAHHGSETHPRIGHSGRYLDNGDGTVTDAETGLQWMRCSLGQKWDGNTCVGEAAECDWREALDEANEHNRRGGYAGHSDWRVPSIEELHSLVGCLSGLGYQRPTIDLDAFPNTSVGWYWSASPCAGNSDNAWYVYFRLGRVRWTDKGNNLVVRLVRGGQ